jgi:MFS family permease
MASLTPAVEPEAVIPSKARQDRYGAYALGVLLLAYMFSFIDRQVLNLLVEPIKQDLRLTDIQISLLQGLAFAVFLSLAGLPIGRRIDSGARTPLLAIGVATWSLCTAAGGLARSFAPLFLTRVGAGAGEAAMTPGAYSLIGDYFTPRRLGLAIGVFAMGPYLGSGLAFLLGGLLAGAPGLPGLGLKSWQVAFLVAGLAGLVPAAWVATLKEPPRRAGRDAPPSWSEVATFVQKRWKAVLPVNLAQAFAAMATFATASWAPAMLMRSFHTPPAEVGGELGLVSVICGAAGALSSGLIGDALRRRGLACGRLYVMIFGLAGALTAGGLLGLATSKAAVLVLAAPLLFSVTLALGSGPALLQEITPNRMRGLQHAFGVLTANMLGLGLGPTVVATVTDLVIKDETKLQLSLAICLPAILSIALALALAALRSYRPGLDDGASLMDSLRNPAQ